MINQLMIALERRAWNVSQSKKAGPVRIPLRVATTIWRGLHQDRLWLHAGYMSYLSLLHLVPLGALALAISTRIGWKEALMNWVENSLSPTAPQLARKMVMAMDRLDLAALGYFGLAAIIIAGVFSVSRLEKDLGAIWNTPVRRSTWQRLLLYPAAIILLPAVVALVLAFGTIAEARTTLWIQELTNWGGGGQLLYRALTNVPLLFRITPFLLSWSMLTVVYWLGTPARVKLKSAILGGLVGAILWTGAQSAYLNFQFATSTYREVWGYLAQMPLLLIWIYASWMILYAGAEFTFAWQHRLAHQPKLPLFEALRSHDELNAAVCVASAVAKSLPPGAELAAAPEISGLCALPLRLVEHVAARLADAGILRITRDGRRVVYTTAEDIGAMTIGTLIARYRHASHVSATEQAVHTDLHPDTRVIDVG
ncbi:MAG: YihY/virulence factor BrkB family protein [candidate division Zixibacteria bacterium]|nr:YihY/virulence factor BrkB family protein [candidate division Zixibacteria bacterium]